MSTPGILVRRRPRPRPVAKPRRPRIVAVTEQWRVTDDGTVRRVIARNADDSLTAWWLADDHPALVRFLDRVAAAAAVTA